MRLEEPGDLLSDWVEVNVVETRPCWQTRHGAHLRRNKANTQQIKVKTGIISAVRAIRFLTAGGSGGESAKKDIFSLRTRL